MPKAFSGLPDRPVTEVETQALDQHSDIDFCHPVYQLADDPESIVVIVLAKDDRAYFLYFNTERRRWEQLVDTDMPEAVTDEIPFEEDVVEDRLHQHYDLEDLEPAGYPGDPVLGAVQNFPSQPLTEQQIEQMQRQHLMIGEVVPLVRTADGTGILALIFFFDDVFGGQRITAAAGYHPEIGEWELIASAESSDPNLDDSLEGLQTAYAHWVDAHYTMDEIQPIEDPEAALKSPPQ